MNQLQINRAALINYLDSQGWHYNVQRDDENGYFVKLGFNLNCRLNSAQVIIVADETGIQSLGVSPINANQNDYDKVVEYITRANYGLKLGKFEFDYRDGEVRYQSFLANWAGQPHRENVEFAVDFPVRMLEKYGDGLVKSLMGFGNPEEDIAAAEA